MFRDTGAPSTSEAVQASVRDAHIFTKVCAVFCSGCSMALGRLRFMNSRHTPRTLVCQTPV